MPRSWSSSLAAAIALAAAAAGAQEPGFRISYGVHVFAPSDGVPRLVASGAVSGPQDTDLRLTLRTDTAEVDALLDVFAEPDTANLSAAFFTRRRAGRSRRGLALWETDSYRREARLAWGGTARLYPFGQVGGRDRALWVEISVTREFVAGETRPTETFSAADSSVAVAIEAVVRPRRANVRLTLMRGDTASAPRVLDMVPDAAAQHVTFVLGPGPGRSRMLDVSLTRPDPPLTGRDSALAVDADVVCLRVLDSAAVGPALVQCGRLNNVARRLALSNGDTLVATFRWPAAR